MTAPIGQLTERVPIIGITNALPCEVTTEFAHGFPNKSFVRLTDLNGAMPIPRGEDPLNNYKFRIIVTGDTTFILQDPISFLPVDSTTYPPYVTGGSCNLVQQNFVFYPSPNQVFPN
jgi:hypothetical protein